MAYEHIILEIESGLATITFNRPKAMNALNGALIGELSRALDFIATNEDIRVLILTGAGDKSFVAGENIYLHNGQNGFLSSHSFIHLS